MTDAKRSLFLLWPLWLAPFAALLAVKLAGPGYTDAPNQAAMVIRLLGIVAWFLIVSIGTVITLVSIKQKKRTDYLVCGFAAIASCLLYLAISTSMK